MKRLFAALLAFLALAAATPCAAALSAPTNAGANFSNTTVMTGSVTLGAGVTANVGDTIIVIFSAGAGSTAFSANDDAGDEPTPGVFVNIDYK